MKRFLFFLISFLTGFLLFYWVIKWVGWQEIRGVLFTFFGYKGMTILGITLLIWLFSIWQWKFILKSQGYNFSSLALGEIIFASFPITYLFTPTAVFGGEIFKVYALKKKFSLPLEKNVASVAIERLLSASMLLIYLIFGAIAFVFLAQTPIKNFRIIALSLIGLLAIALAIFYFKSFKKESILKRFLRFFRIKNKKNHLPEEIEKEIFHFFDFRKNVMWKGLAISFLRYFLILSRIFLIVFFLKGGLDIFVPLAIMFFLYLAHLFPIPADMGSLEGIQVLVFSALGLGAASGITFSFILRGADIIIALFGFVLLIKLGIKFFIGSFINIISRFSFKR